MRLPRSLFRAAPILLLAAGMGCSAEPDPKTTNAPERAATEQAPLVLANPPWTSTAPMAGPHAYHTATLLLNGNVLVVGGKATVQTYLNTAELFDPVTKMWSSAMPLSSERASHTATLLPSGKVLVTGGFGKNGPMASAVAAAELYDPATKTWSPAGSMKYPRLNHAATLLGDGTVLVTGGYDGTMTINVTAELYDGTSWQPQPTGPAPRYNHTATLLNDGRVLVAAGYSAPGNLLATAELYDPTTKTWSPAGSLMAVRSLHTATLLSDRRVLVTGGETTMGMKLNTAELYDPTTNMWSTTGNLGANREWHTATLVGNIRVLVAGGLSGPVLNSVELYDPALGTWPAASATMLNGGRYTHTATLLGDGRVLVAGGQDSVSYLASAEIYQPSQLGAPCMGPGECVSGFCESGICCAPPCCTLPEGTACDDKNPCTDGDKCQSGGCAGTRKSCALPTSPCHDAACDPATGLCVVASSPKPAGSPCDDGDQCTTLDQCDMTGTCVGTTVECPAQDICHDPGTCSPATGVCDSPPKPSCDPPSTKPPTVPANVKLCKSAKECKTGFCVDGVCCDSACDKPCHSCALLETAGTCTLEPAGVDLRHECEIGFNCLSTCGGTEDGACIGAGNGTQCRAISCTDETHGITAATCSMYGPTCPTGDTVPFNCWPFRCAAALGACFTTCSSVSDCAPSLVCDPTHHCVAPPPVANNKNLGGCALSARGPGSALPGLAALLAALAAASLRRRARQSLP